MDPAPPPALSKREQRRRDNLKERSRRLYEVVRAAPLERPGADPQRVLCFGIAVLTLLPTPALAALGAYWFVSLFPHLAAFLLGIPLLVLAWTLAPRLGRVSKHESVVSRAEAPVLYGVVDRVAAHLKAHSADTIVVNGRFNAAHGRVGLRRRRILWIGAPLWNAINGQQRVALLAHELGHQINGDLTHGLVVGSALRTLATWHALLRPGRRRRTRSMLDFAESIARSLLFLLRALVAALYRGERRLAFRSQQRAEYLADILSARVGTKGGALALLDRLYLARVCLLALRFAAQRGQQDLWSAQREFLENLPAHEWERYRRINARDALGVDTSHPPTHLRVRLLQERTVAEQPVVVTDAEWERADAELERSMTKISSDIRDSVRA